MKILLITKDNKLLLDKQLDKDILIDDSINISLNEEAIVIKLLNDYKCAGDVTIGIEDGEIVYKTK